MMRKIKITALDKLFSRFIRSRAKWTCERCHTRYPPPTSALHCSHFHGRGKKSVRWDPSNAAALCFGCHLLFTGQPQQHVEWFRARLGEEEFNALRDRANSLAPMTQDRLALVKHWLSEVTDD